MKKYLVNLNKMKKVIIIMKGQNMKLIKENHILKVDEITERKKHMKKI